MSAGVSTRSSVRVAVVAAWFGVLAIGLVQGTTTLFLATAAALASAAAVVTTRAVRNRPPRERTTWRWFLRAAWIIPTGLWVETALTATPSGTRGASTTVGLTVATIAASGMFYQAIQYWNRTRVDDWQAAEWFAGVGGVLAVSALVALLTDRADRFDGRVPVWELYAHGLQIAALVVVAVTLVASMVTAHLLADWRAWALLVVVVALCVLESLEYVRVATGADGDGRNPTLVGVVWCWVTLSLMTTLACLSRPVVRSRVQLSSAIASSGALVVVVGGTGVVVLDAVLGGSRVDVPLLASAAALAGTLRLTTMVREFADLTHAQRDSRTDGLTGVANRRAFVERLERRLERGREVTVMMVDLNDFKVVNDDRGHGVGDELMRVVAGRMSDTLGARGMLARIGGDEFAVLLDEPSADEAHGAAESILAAVRTPTTIDQQPVTIDASIGVVSTQHSAPTVAELMRHADSAMYAAKREGGGITFFDEQVAADTERRVDLLRDLRTVLTSSSDEAGRLVVHYQPQVSCSDGSVVGAEALVRWDHPVHGLLPPGEFLDLAERHQLMARLTVVVLRTAVTDASHWLESGWRLPVSVNLSASSLTYPQLRTVLSESLRNSALPPELLTLEVTETSIMDDPGVAIAALAAIAEHGVHVSIDDYGTGYSSLTYLNHLPARELKLDRAFTQRLLADERTGTIVQGTVELAHRLGLEVTAEGVEDVETCELLTALGCDRTQGFLHSRPLPVEEFTRWLGEAEAEQQAV